MSDNTDRELIITNKMLEAFAENNIEDNPKNRFYFLTGVYEGWEEEKETDPDFVLEKALYMITLTTMKLMLSLQIQRDKLIPKQ